MKKTFSEPVLRIYTPANSKVFMQSVGIGWNDAWGTDWDPNQPINPNNG